MKKEFKKKVRKMIINSAFSSLKRSEKYSKFEKKNNNVLLKQIKSFLNHLYKKIFNFIAIYFIKWRIRKIEKNGTNKFRKRQYMHYMFDQEKKWIEQHLLINS